MNAAHTIAPPAGTVREVHRVGSTDQIIGVLLAADQLAAPYTVHFAESLRGATTKATAKNIHTFIQDNIEYREDPPGVQDIKSPAKLYASGFG